MGVILDLLGSEYGWTCQYVLEELTRPQVEVFLEAIGSRYRRQADAIKGLDSDEPEFRMPETGPLSPSVIQEFGIKVT